MAQLSPIQTTYPSFSSHLVACGAPLPYSRNHSFLSGRCKDCNIRVATIRTGKTPNHYTDFLDILSDIESDDVPDISFLMRTLMKWQIE